MQTDLIPVLSLRAKVRDCDLEQDFEQHNLMSHAQAIRELDLELAAQEYEEIFSPAAGTRDQEEVARSLPVLYRRVVIKNFKAASQKTQIFQDPRLWKKLRLLSCRHTVCTSTARRRRSTFTHRLPLFFFFSSFSFQSKFVSKSIY